MHGTGTGGADRAFTLIELLVVIAVIAILLGIAVTLGSSVISGGKATRTEQTIGVLDSMLTSYVSERGRAPSESVQDPRSEGTSNPRYLPVADARNMTAMMFSDQQPLNSVGLFLLQAQDVPAVDASLKSLDPKLVQRFDPDEPDDPGSPEWELQPELVTVLDGWGRPIRFVHPSFDGVQFGDLPSAPPSLPPSAPLPFDADPYDVATHNRFSGKIVPRTLWSASLIRRNNVQTLATDDMGEDVVLAADSDGGICRGDQAYFYSAGEDEDPGTIEGNVYTTKPQFPVIRN